MRLLAVAARLAIRNRQQRLPHALLKRRADQIKLGVEVLELAFEVRVDLRAQGLRARIGAQLGRRAGVTLDVAPFAVQPLRVFAELQQRQTLRREQGHHVAERRGVMVFYEHD